MLATDRVDVSPREALTVRRIVKVNHAGEYGAIRIGVVTEALIWLSTWGDSQRMARDLRLFREAQASAALQNHAYRT